MRIKNTAASLLILCGLLQFIGCSNQKGIVGKWQQVEGTETIEFLKDGSFVVEKGGRPMGGGKYTVVDDNRIKIEPSGMMAVTGPMLTKYVIAGEDLTLTGPDGGDTKYHSLKQTKGDESL